NPRIMFAPPSAMVVGDAANQMRYRGSFTLLSSQGLLKMRRSSNVDNKYGDVMARADVWALGLQVQNYPVTKVRLLREGLSDVDSDQALRFRSSRRSLGVALSGKGARRCRNLHKH